MLGACTQDGPQTKWTHKMQSRPTKWQKHQITTKVCVRLRSTMIAFSKDDFELMGLGLCGWSDKTIKRNCANTNLERFKDQCHVTPTTCQQLFDDTQADDNQCRIIKPKPKYLLLASCYLKKHPTKIAMAAFLDSCYQTALDQSSLKWLCRCGQN